jgi:hypothetical protein
MTAVIDRARLPYLVDPTTPAGPGGGEGGDQGDDGPGKPAKRGGPPGSRRMRVRARAPAYPAHAQADRGRPHRVRALLRPVRAARG